MNTDAKHEWQVQDGLQELFDDEYSRPGKQYLLPYGTPLTLSDFEPHRFHSDGVMGWRIDAFDWDGELTTYVIKPLPGRPRVAKAYKTYLPVLLGFSDRHLIPLKCQRVDTRLLVPVDRVTNWCDWILRQDAYYRTAPQENPGDESLDDLAATMKKLERDITDYISGEENLGTFKTVKAFQDWLDWVLASSPVSAEVFQVWPRQMGDGMPSSDLLTMARATWTGESDGGDGTVLDGSEGILMLDEVSFSSDLTMRSWLHDMGRTNMHVGLSVKASGGQFTGYEAYGCIPWVKLQQAAKLTRNTRRRSKWWGVHVLKTDLAMVFPSFNTNVFAEVDEDGLMTSINPWSTFVRASFHFARDRYEREFGRWLDPSTELTVEELDRGVAWAEAVARGEHPKLADFPR